MLGALGMNFEDFFDLEISIKGREDESEVRSAICFLVEMEMVVPRVPFWAMGVRVILVFGGRVEKVSWDSDVNPRKVSLTTTAVKAVFGEGEKVN